MPVVKVSNNRGDDLWLMPDGLPDSVQDMDFDYEGVMRLASAVYKGAYDDLVRSYSLFKRRMWERYPERYSKGMIKRCILQAEGWFYDNPFPVSLEPRYFVRRARIEVFGPKWMDLPYFVERRRAKAERKKRKTPG